MKGKNEKLRLFVASAVMILMLLTEWRMALPVMGTALIVFLLRYIVRRHTRRYAPAQREAFGRLRSYAEEIYWGHDVVRLSRAGRQAKENFRELNGAVYSASRRAQFARNLEWICISLMGSLALAAAWISGAWLVLKGEIGLGVVAVFTLYIGVLALTLNQRNTRK